MDGRYTILGSIAKGGMATVYLGRVLGSAGFSRLVAIKRLHPDLAAEKEFVGMLVDEARLASQIRHTNVIDTLDLVVSDGAFSLVLEYVEGDSLARLLKQARRLAEPVPPRIAVAIMYGVLRGLDAAHEARNEDGQPLGIVHRDVSPQNVLIGVDGIPRVIDFGVAKAIGRFDSTRPGEIRGKFSYMAPEQMQARPVTRQVDVYAAGVVLWELLAGRRLFDAEDPRVICAAVLRGDIKGPRAENTEVTPELDAIVLRATAREVGDRYLTAREALTDLEKLERASDDEVGAWVRRLSAAQLADRQRLIQDAAPAADGRPLEDLMADLARSGVPALESSPGVREVDDSDTVLASTAGTGLDLPPSSKGLTRATPATSSARSRNNGVFGAALVIVGALVVVALFLQFRTNPSPRGTSVAADPDMPLFPSAPALPALSDSSASSAASASSAPDDPDTIELPDTPASSTGKSNKTRAKLPRAPATVAPVPPVASVIDPRNIRK